MFSKADRGWHGALFTKTASKNTAVSQSLALLLTDILRADYFENYYNYVI